MWRPKEGWDKCPCDDCEKKVEDNYGLLCDLACGQHNAWLNSEAGADAHHEAVIKFLEDHKVLVHRYSEFGKEKVEVTFEFIEKEWLAFTGKEVV